MPEIALTGQFLDRFAQRFGVRPLEWHSELTPRTRQRNWAAIAAGEAPVVVGARSALFLPYADLGLIIVDEEHDQAYKQDDGAHYHARDMAVVRAHIAKIPIVLASATPSVESEVNARKGRYQRVALPSRFGGQHMPHIEAIDLRRAPPPRGRFISPPLAEADSVRDREARTGAVVSQPPRLRAADIMPRLRASLRLHRSATPGWWIIAFASAWSVTIAASRCRARTSARIARPRNCWSRSVRASSACRKRRRAVSERAHHGAVERSHHLDRDHAQRAERNRARAASTSSSARNWWRRDIIFRGSIWSAWSMPIWASAMAIRAPPSGRFNCCNQVIGRAGREQGRGVGYLQTHQPEHPVMKALVASDREAFYASEIEARERAGYPPFGRLASLIISARRPADRGRFRAQACGDRADRRAHPGAGPGRGAARGHQGPLPVPPAGEVAAQCRSVGISARMAGRRGRRPRAISSSRSTSIRRAFCR